MNSRQRIEFLVELLHFVIADAARMAPLLTQHGQPAQSVRIQAAIILDTVDFLLIVETVLLGLQQELQRVDIVRVAIFRHENNLIVTCKTEVPHELSRQAN